MTKRVLQTETSGMVKAASVADYIVERLAAEGISHCFGVAGDYVFPICDAVDNSAKVKWIGCANELNASYAADGYARIRGAAMLVTTYGVGELSALNGVMGAKAERSLVFHVVGMPSYQHQRVRKITHHTLGDGVFGNFVHLSAAAGCCHGDHQPRELRCRNGASHRRGAPRKSAGLYRRAIGLRAGIGLMSAGTTGRLPIRTGAPAAYTAGLPAGCSLGSPAARHRQRFCSRNGRAGAGSGGGLATCGGRSGAMDRCGQQQAIHKPRIGRLRLARHGGNRPGA